MNHNAHWQLFTESGDPLAYLDYRKSMRKKRKAAYENV